MLYGRPMRFRELGPMRRAPASNDVFGDFEVALKGEVFAEDKALVQAMLAEQRAGRFHRNREAFVVPVEGVDLGRVSEDEVPGWRDPQVAPPDAGECIAVHGPSQRSRHQLPAEAVTEHGDVARDGISDQPQLSRYPSSVVVRARVGPERDHATEEAGRPR